MLYVKTVPYHVDVFFTLESQIQCDTGAFANYKATHWTKVNYKATHWTKVGPLPEGVSTKVAAAGIISGLTALTFLKEAYAVKPNDWILIHAVAGGFGLQATQVSSASHILPIFQKTIDLLHHTLARKEVRGSCNWDDFDP